MDDKENQGVSMKSPPMPEEVEGVGPLRFILVYAFVSRPNRLSRVLGV